MQEAMHAARLAMLEGAALGILRELSEEGGSFDGFTLTARAVDGVTLLEVNYLSQGLAMAGESL